MEGEINAARGLFRLRWNPMLTGVVLFLISEFFLFGALFFSYYYLRSVTQTWPPDGVQLAMARPVANTAILLTSSLVLQLGVIAARRGQQGRAT